MARERLFCILQYLRLVDSSLQKKRGEVGYDALYKMRPLLDHVTAVFCMYYQHEREISINEMMIGTKCRVAFLQYLPKKPTKFGIKRFSNSESKIGYALALHVYIGACSIAVDTNKNGAGYRVVMDLLERYQGKEHCIIMYMYIIII